MDALTTEIVRIYHTYPHSEHLSLSQRRYRLTQVKILECNNQDNSTFPLDFPLSVSHSTKFALHHT